MPYPGSLLLVKSPALSSVPEWQERRSLAVSLLAALEKRDRKRERERHREREKERESQVAEDYIRAEWKDPKVNWKRLLH